MKRGFTILELLVASLLLGMLMTILTMIFEQSSIAWRSGTAVVADLDGVRQNLAEVRDEADNAYVWDNKVHRIVGLWKDNGTLRDRAWDVGTEAGGDNSAQYLQSRAKVNKDDSPVSDFNNLINVSATGNYGSLKTYKINVKCAGPDKEFDTYDDVWSNPDEF